MHGFMRSLLSCSFIIMLFSLSMEAQQPGYGASFRLESWKKNLEMKATSPYAGLAWRAAGPEKQGGRIESIAIHPSQPGTIFLGPGSGNLWKSTNNGTTWTPVFDDQPTFAIGCVTIAPSDPSIIWVGTGEVLMARSSYAGIGAFKSEDGGDTWKHMGLEECYHIPRILVDPVDPDIIYAAGLGRNYSENDERGIYKSTDGGETWEKKLFVSERTGFVEIIMDPSDRNTLLAVAWERERRAWNNIIAGEESGIYKSTDGGESWKRITRWLPADENVGRFGIAWSPSDNNIVYAVLDNQSPKASGNGQVRGEIYRSDDRGESWVKTHDGDLPTGIGYDFCLVRVSPDNPDEIFVCGNKLIHSTDGGKTFEFTGETIVHLLSHDIRVMHLDMHELVIDPVNPDRLLLGNDGGLYMSYDRGVTWLHYNNLPIGEFYAVSVDNADPYNIYGGTQDDAALYGPGNHDISKRLTDYGVEDPWKHIYLDRWGGGDSYFTFVDRADPDIIYYEHQFGELRRKRMSTGETTGIMPREEKGEDPLRRNWMSPFFISQYNPEVIYYGANMIFRSENRGDSWRRISDDLSTKPGTEKQGNVPFGTITSISESPLREGVLVVGTDDGNIQFTENDGSLWAKINSDLPDKWVTKVVSSRFDINRVYVTFTGYRDDDFNSYIYKSDNLGESWKAISANLPPEPANVIIEDPRDSDILYLGTDLGVYVTFNGGDHWYSLSSGLPTTPVYDLVIQEREMDLVAATHGRSIFVLDISGIEDPGNK
ncbi:MAG: hypothetical protein E4G95_02305 [Bacteroidia bacterium]|nr:MAG: hypothetical protein E4G95_02305 [Bacteroidia bacterium]